MVGNPCSTTVGLAANIEALRWDPSSRKYFTASTIGVGAGAWVKPTSSTVTLTPGASAAARTQSADDRKLPASAIDRDVARTEREVGATPERELSRSGSARRRPCRQRSTRRRSPPCDRTRLRRRRTRSRQEPDYCGRRLCAGQSEHAGPLVRDGADDRQHGRRRAELARQDPRRHRRTGAGRGAPVVRQTPVGDRISRQGRSDCGETPVSTHRPAPFRWLLRSIAAALVAGSLLSLAPAGADATTIERVVTRKSM